MSNGFYNGQNRSSPVKASGGGYDNPRGRSKMPMPFTEKVGFPKAALPGKAQSKDRSGGVKKLKVRPDEKGL